MKHFSALILTLTLGSAAFGQQASPPHVMPPLDRPWTPSDYTTVVDMIASQEVRLPIYTAGGGPLLRRYLARENLASLHDPALPPAERMVATGVIGKATGRLFTLYMDAVRQGKIVHVEVGQLLAMSLDITATEAQVVDENFKTGERTPTPEQQAQLAQLGRMFAGLFSATADGVSDKKVLSMADCDTVLTAAAIDYPAVDHFIDPAARAQLRQKYQALRDQARLPHDVHNLDKLLAVLNR